MVKYLEVVLGKRKYSTTNEKVMWKKKSCLWELPYMEELDVRHCINVMHVEKNVCESLIGFLLELPDKTKDGIKSRKDLVDLGIRKNQHPKVNEKGK